jgi:uncharacterized protein YdaU (DUF1376 family)
MTKAWYKRYPSDFLHGTAMLSCEEKGAYTVALDLMYERGGPIPNDGVWIARMCGCSVRKWTQTLLPALIAAGKLWINDGKVSNGRMEFETQISDERSETARESGRKGGLGKAERAASKKIISDLSPIYPPDKSEIIETELNENNDMALADSETQKERKKDRQTARAREDACRTPEEYAKAALGYAPSDVTVNSIGHIVCGDWDLDYVADKVFEAARIDPAAWQGDLKPVIRWLLAGTTPKDIVRGIERHYALGRDPPRFSFALFDAFIIRSLAPAAD